jgi:hypothetical protein
MNLWAKAQNTINAGENTDVELPLQILVITLQFPLF